VESFTGVGNPFSLRRLAPVANLRGGAKGRLKFVVLVAGSHSPGPRTLTTSGTHQTCENQSQYSSRPPLVTNSHLSIEVGHGHSGKLSVHSIAGLINPRFSRHLESFKPTIGEHSLCRRTIAANKG